MQITILAIAARQPDWVAAGVDAYLKRLPRGWNVELINLPLGKRGKSGDSSRAITDEGKRLLARVGDRVLVALDERGKPTKTADLAVSLAAWARDGRNIVFAIGGPDGHAPAVIDRADRVVSLSEMTLPHGLVRVMLAEQIYRCWSILNRHPYHRE